MKKPRSNSQTDQIPSMASPAKRKHRRAEDEPSSEEEISMTNYEAFMMAIQQSAVTDEPVVDKRSRAVSSDRSSENGSDEITAIMNFDGTKFCSRFKLNDHCRSTNLRRQLASHSIQQELRAIHRLKLRSKDKVTTCIGIENGTPMI